MKTILLLLGYGLTAGGLGAQGIVRFDNCAGVRAPVYGPEPANPYEEKHGNTATGIPAGSQIYGGALVSGDGFTAELWFGVAGSSEANLSPLVATAFRKDVQAGCVFARTATIPGVSQGQSVVLQMRAWDNRGGALTSWYQAMADDSVWRGKSELFIETAGGSVTPPPATLNGLRSFNLHLPAGAPIITQQPQDTTQWAGGTATFVAAAQGYPAVQSQWYNEGILISTGTNATLVLPAVKPIQAGRYQLIASNVFGSATSALAVLTVQTQISLISPTQSWRYQENANLDSNHWTDNAYDDIGWPSGLGMFAFENNPAVTSLVHTVLADPRLPIPGAPAPRTYYFRTGFDWTLADSNWVLVASNLIDDGAVLHLNGLEQARYNMNTGAVTYASLSAGVRSGGDVSTWETLLLVRPSLALGANLLAVSLHQSASNSSDAVFGMVLEARYPSPVSFTDATEPTNAVVALGTAHTLRVLAQSFPPPTYQWYFAPSSGGGYAPIPDATNATHLIGSMAQSLQGSYYCHLVNAASLEATNSRAALISVPTNSVIVSFQRGVAGYTGTQDTELRAAEPATVQGFRNDWITVDLLDGAPAGPAQALVRFDNILGNAAAQVPFGATIQSATLTLYSTASNADSANPVNVHRMLQNWSESTATYDSLGNGVQPNDGEAAAAVAASLVADFPNPGGSNTQSRALDVTAAVQAWADGQPNYGWALLPTGSDGYRFDPSEFASAANHPLLVVSYAAGGSLAVRITALPPTNRFVVHEGDPFSFGFGVSGSDLHFQWFKSSAPIPGATQPSFASVAALPPDSGTYYLRITNSLPSATNSPLILVTVIPDVTGPNLVSAIGETNLDAITLLFSEPIAPAGAGNAASYRVDVAGSGSVLPVLSATLLGPATVRLQTPPRLLGLNYQVAVSSNVTDTAYNRNPVLPPNHTAGVRAQVVLLDWSTAWKYQAETNLDGRPWTSPNFEDAAWPAGPGLFGLETSQVILSSLPPIRTPLPATNRTVYFRTGFHTRWTLSGANAVLVIRHAIDDGAVVYLDGSEVLRFNLPAGTVSNATLASAAIETMLLATNAAPEVLGSNFDRHGAAVEVHPSANTSSDVVFGLELVAEIFSFPPAPIITRNPESQNSLPGATVPLSVVATGAPPMLYQWLLDETPIPGATNASLVLTQVQPAHAGAYRVVVQNPAGAVVSEAAILGVGFPPVITAPLVSTNVFPGTDLTLVAAAEGTGPLIYQWRLNGANIPGATNAVLSLPNLQTTNGGVYSVAVANPFGAVLGERAVVTLILVEYPGADAFLPGNLPILDGFSNVIRGANSNATFDLGEPLHAGKPGGRSVWYTFVAPDTGIATIRTRGSTFDTLLAVYLGESYSTLLPVASDEDRGGFYTSDVRFNALAFQSYHVAVDGYAGGAGVFILEWNLESTFETLPIITHQPVSETVVAGAFVQLQVAAIGEGIRAQWFFRGTPLPGASNLVYTLANVHPANVGTYFARITNVFGRWVESDHAAIEIGPYDFARSQDKVEDLFGTNIAPNFEPAAARGRQSRLLQTGSSGFVPVTAGGQGTHIFDNSEASSQAGEAPPCGVLGGSSQWFGLRPDTAGVMMVDTLGSTYDTVIAVYSGTNSLRTLRTEACDNSGAPDKVRSLAYFEAKADTNYSVAVDSADGKRGTTYLNYQLLVAPSQFECWFEAQTCLLTLRIHGPVGQKLVLLSTTRFVSGPGTTLWLPLLTLTIASSGYVEHVIDTLCLPGARFYRAVPAPSP